MGDKDPRERQMSSDNQELEFKDINLYERTPQCSKRGLKIQKIVFSLEYSCEITYTNQEFFFFSG